MLFPLLCLVTRGLAAQHVINPVASFIAPGDHISGEAASLGEVYVSMSQSTLPQLNLHFPCTLQSDLKCNLEVCSKTTGSIQKNPACILKVPLHICSRSLRNLTHFFCQYLKLDLKNQDKAISQATYLFQCVAEYKCNNLF